MNSQEIIEQRKMEKLWESCYLRLKRILAGQYINKRLYVYPETISPFTIKRLAENGEAVEIFKKLKADYETGLQAIKEKWTKL